MQRENIVQLPELKKEKEDTLSKYLSLRGRL